MIDTREIHISLEKMINEIADRNHFSKEQKERMYREWANLTDKGTVKFNDRGNIVGFAPDIAIEKVDLKIMISANGEVEIV